METQSVLTPQQFQKAGVPEASGSKKFWPVYIQLTNDRVYGADVIVNATGVVPTCHIHFEGSHKV